MLGIAGFILLWYLIWRLIRTKKEPIEPGHDSDYFIQKYGLLKDFPTSEPTKSEPPINIYITNNHLHIHTTPEGNQPR